MKQVKSIPKIFSKYSDGFFLLYVFVISCFYFSGIPHVPFHPDESTYLFMSSDIKTLINSPDKIFWNKSNPTDTQQKYRLIDPPVTRYIIELSNLLYKEQSLSLDWNWSKTWTENLSSGAYPTHHQLIAGRSAAGVFFPFSLILIYLIGNKLGKKTTGWVAAVLFSSNALILLHSRRAMSESALIFTGLLAIYIFFRLKENSGFSGLFTGLAFCAKASNGALLISGFFTTLFRSYKEKQGWKITLQNILIYTFGVILIFLVLNPVFWSNPLIAAQQAWSLRSNLAKAQQESISQSRPELILNTLPKRVAAILVQSYYTKPATADVGNYLADTVTQDFLYLDKPLHIVLRGLVWGSIYLGLTLFGLILSILHIYNTQDENHIILLLSGLFQFAALSIAVAIPFQRYYLPIIPYICLWTGYGISRTISQIAKFHSGRL